ncbi:unnamed protein product [Caenorhabditis angaria]|uniref:BZIP domain-containing protein n=1 Tax=Caenorhabditis angaria TaxID=860376 RepID=A0A9P1J181_9PELO|nr:unnamed protein product [Caenorhabditis angaria]
MPPPNESQEAAPSTSVGFGRQDSLAVAATLQERDRQVSMVDFMETELDLDNYLACFNELDVPPDQIDLTDGELYKAQLLYDDAQFCQTNDPFRIEYRETYRSYGPRSPDPYKTNYTGSRYTRIAEEKVPEGSQPHDYFKKTTRPVKKIPPYKDDDFDEMESNEDSCSEINSCSEESHSPSPTPQKEIDWYQKKHEKKEDGYKLKRARNNDAVRKSRSKAKEAQMKKEKEYADMKSRISELEGLLEAEKQARKRDRETIERLLQKN